MVRRVGELLNAAMRRESRKGDRIRLETPPVLYLKTRGNEDFVRIDSVVELRVLLRTLVRFSPNHRVTFRVDVELMSWREPEGRVVSEKNSFTVEIDDRGRVVLLHKSLAFPETWEDDPRRVDATAERIGQQVFRAIAGALKRVRGDAG